MRTYVHTYIRTCVHTTCIHTYIHAYPHVSVIYPTYIFQVSCKYPTYILYISYIYPVNILHISYMHPTSILHTHTQTYIHACIHTYIHAHIHTYVHTYIHTYIRTYIHTYMHAYIHTYIHTQVIYRGTTPTDSMGARMESAMWCVCIAPGRWMSRLDECNLRLLCRQASSMILWPVPVTYLYMCFFRLSKSLPWCTRPGRHPHWFLPLGPHTGLHFPEHMIDFPLPMSHSKNAFNKFRPSKAYPPHWGVSWLRCGSSRWSTLRGT